MGKILTYSSMFEGKAEDEKLEEFNKALNSPEGKDFQKWFDIKHVRTGRAYIHKKDEIKGIGIPSRSYFDFNGDRWYYEFSSSNGTYGTTYNQDLKSLFRIFMVDSVRKSRPSSIKESKIKEFFSKDSNFPRGSFPDPNKIYSSIKEESGFINDFSFLMDLPIIKRISDLGIETDYNDTRNFVFLYFTNGNSFIPVIFPKIFGEEYTDSISKTIENIPYLNIRFFDGIKPLSIEPKTDPGKKAIDGKHYISFRLGFDSKEKIEKYTEDFIKDKIKLIPPEIVRGRNRTIIEPLGEYINKKILGEPVGDLLEKSKERIEEIILDFIGPQIEDNHLNLYFLDELPELKKKAMEKYRIEKDFSKLGKTMGKGWFGE